MAEPNYDLNDPPVMACGCAANAYDGNGDPVCVIHIGFSTDAQARTVVDTPNLEGRTARCTYNKGGGCGGKEQYRRYECPRFGCDSDEGVPSRTTLPFFKHQPTMPHDSFYCGCWGWD